MKPDPDFTGVPVRPASAWARLPMWQKRLRGFASYSVAAVAALIWPVEADKAMYTALRDQFEDGSARDAARYRWLRERDLDTTHAGGVFAGMTPANVVLNGEDLDGAIDAAMLVAPSAKITGAGTASG